MLNFLQSAGEGGKNGYHPHLNPPPSRGRKELVAEWDTPQLPAGSFIKDIRWGFGGIGGVVHFLIGE
jgi:hypothetical protein